MHGEVRLDERRLRSFSEHRPILSDLDQARLGFGLGGASTEGGQQGRRETKRSRRKARSSEGDRAWGSHFFAFSFFGSSAGFFRCSSNQP
jgi:hypothetical protein